MGVGGAWVYKGNTNFSVSLGVAGSRHLARRPASHSGGQNNESFIYLSRGKNKTGDDAPGWVGGGEMS